MDSPRSPQTPLSSELRKMIHDRNILTTKSRMKVLNSLNESDKKYHEEKEKTLRYQAIQEILTTEATYLRQLEITMEYFIQPIYEKNLLDHILLSTLSENIKTLYNVSGELVKELKKDPHNVAGAFHKLAPFFKLYSVYAYDYEQILSVLQITQANNPAFNDFICKQETRPEVGTKLPSLLITPIQRVPRYKLLVKEVLQHTPTNHREYNLLQVCLVEIEKAARHINTLVAQNEETQKLLRLQKCILNPINLVKPGRKLIKQGALMRVSRRGTTAYKRYFVLLSDTLLYCKGDPENSLTVCCVLPLNKCKVESVLSGGLFRVTCLNETLLLYSEKYDSDLWIEAIETSIKRYTDCRQTLRKDSSSRQPLRHHNINLFPSENIPKVSTKRKRLEEEAEVALDASRIMYLKTDIEADADAPLENNCLLLFKKLKKLKKDGNNGASETFVNSTSQESLSTCTGSENVSIRQQSLKTSNTWNNIDIRNKGNNISVNLPPLSHSESKTSSTFKAVGEFLSYVGSSLKEFFKFR